MKEWNTPAIKTITLAETENYDGPSKAYDGDWAQDSVGQYYALGKES